MFNSKKKRSPKNANPVVENDFNGRLYSELPRQYIRFVMKMIEMLITPLIKFNGN